MGRYTRDVSETNALVLDKDMRFALIQVKTTMVNLALLAMYLQKAKKVAFLQQVTKLMFQQEMTQVVIQLMPRLLVLQ